MANERVFRIARLTDKQIVALFKKLDQAFPAHSSNFMFGDHLQHTLQNLPTELLERSSHSIGSAQIYGQSPKKYTVLFARGISEGSFNTRIPSSIADEIQIQINQGGSPVNVNLEDYLKLVGIVEKETKTLSVTDSKDDLSNTSILHAELKSLSELATELTVGADTKRRELDSKRDELDDAFNAKEAALEKDFEEKEKSLDDKTAELEALRKELDDREHKHVRRALRETITNEIQERIAKPARPTGVWNYNAFALLLALVGVGILASLAFLTQASITKMAATLESNSIEFFFVYFKVLLSSAGALGLLLYVVSWFRSLAAQEIDYRRKLEQYVFDMNRASWTIETMLELSDSELDEVPQSWLDSVTNNLFENGSSKNEDTSSLQALAALLNVTTEAEIGPDGPKFKLNRRGAKKAASDAQ
jgi:hypothetical protein